MVFDPRWRAAIVTFAPGPGGWSFVGTHVVLGLPMGAWTMRVRWGEEGVSDYPAGPPGAWQDAVRLLPDAAEPHRIAIIATREEAPPLQAVLFATLQAGAAEPLVLAGTARDDLILAGAGADLLRGGAGADLLLGGAGDDTLLGGEGADTLIAESGANLLRGGAGDDWLAAGAGHDTLMGEAGHDTLLGGSGDDRLFGGVGHDLLAGEDGDDRLLGEAGNDTLLGEAGNDTLLGGPGNDLLAGGAGNDILVGGPGADTFEAGGGFEVFVSEADGARDVFRWTRAEPGLATIHGFEPGVDLVRLSFLRQRDFFAGRDPEGDAPPGTDILYDTDDGRLLVLAPGMAEPLLLARFLGAPALGAGDFAL